MRNISARLKGRGIKGAALAGAISLSALAGVGLAGSPASATALKADGCALAVSIAHPHAGQTETLTVKTSVASTHVVVKIHYKTVSHTWNFTTPHDRESVYRFGVGRPTEGYRVTLAGSVTTAPKGYRAGATCSTSFTPN
ncbi:MAG TPA: hypothetical protein VH478_17580 [Trebonia sp.]|nr:hypothetical protein [Trebonia sp.]